LIVFEIEEKIVSRKMTIKKLFLIGIGTLSVALGSAGIFLPVLPSTPFFLLAAFCFSRSSSRLYEWLLTNKLFGKALHHYLKYRTIPLKAKITAIIFLWASILISVIAIHILLIRILIILIAAAVTFHLLSLRTALKPEEKDNKKDIGDCKL
jgi:uncharacterized protein